MSQHRPRSPNMAAQKVFKSVTGESSLTFIRPSELAEQGVTGVILEGLYLGTSPNQLDSSKSDYKFESTDGNTVIVNSTGSLAYKMKKVEIGSLVRLIYNGKEEIKKGNKAGKLAHNFDVQVAEAEQAS